MMWKCANFEFDSTRPVVMGILNMTVDGDSLQVTVNHIEGKVNLNNSVILQELRKLAFHS